jgi:signal transduction histidine kinase
MRDLLDYARPSATQMESWSIREVVDKALAATKLYARDAAVMMECHFDPTLDKTRMHPQRVRQALQNLIENAVIFSPRGSTIRVDVSPTVASGSASVTFAVSDSGPGFRDEDVSQAVEPFFTRRRGGTGLGLSIVRRVAEDHGGRVTIGRSPEGGAKVSFSVSLDDDSDD